MIKAVILTAGLLAGAAFGHPHKEPDAESIKVHREILERCGPRVAKMKRDRLALTRRDLSIDADSGDTVYASLYLLIPIK
ncbi:hypothetical protein FALBO_14292, partial [Fusarium albosuccineum]